MKFLYNIFLEYFLGPKIFSMGWVHGRGVELDFAWLPWVTLLKQLQVLSLFPPVPLNPHNLPAPPSPHPKGFALLATWIWLLHHILFLHLADRWTGFPQVLSPLCCTVVEIQSYPNCETKVIPIQTQSNYRDRY